MNIKLNKILNAIFKFLLITLQRFYLCREYKYNLVGENTTDILRPEQMLNFALSSIHTGGKKVPFISPASEAVHTTTFSYRFHRNRKLSFAFSPSIYTKTIKNDNS